MQQSVPKRRHIKFRRRRITQKKAYNIQNTAKVQIKNKTDFVDTVMLRVLLDLPSAEMSNCSRLMTGAVEVRKMK
jgi:putative sterol carrier protein